MSVVMTDEQRALLNTPALSGHFPLHFKYGYTVTALDVTCDGCNKIIPLARMHGRISRSSPFVADVRAIAYCDCGKVAIQRIRLWDDMTFSVLNGDGEWQVGRTAITWKSRLRIKVRKISLRFKQRLGLAS